jgi:YtkA-like
MKKLAYLFITLALTTGLALAKDYEITKKAEDYTVLVKIDKNPPVVGENQVTIEIKDAAGKNVTTAKVKLDYGMPAMSGMPPMAYKADAVLKGTSYQVKMSPSMAGSWNVTLQITQGDKVRKVKFNVDAN